MRLRFPLTILLPLVLVSVAAVTFTYAGCARPTPSTITTPQGKVAYQIEDLVDAVATIQHAAINASRAGFVSRPVALKVTRATRAMAKTLDAAVDAGTGTLALYQDINNGLAQLAGDPDLARFKPEIVAAQAIVAALSTSPTGGRQ